MHLESIDLSEFRGYTHLHLDGFSGLNIISGPNAVGKTNIVEALQLLCSARSFRKPAWQDTISWGAKAARLSALFVEGERQVEHVITLEGNERTCEVNGKRKNAAAFGEACPCVLFVPDDLHLVKDASSRRRAALDDMGSSLSRTFEKLAADYRKVLKLRNVLIRDEFCDGSLFESYTDSLVSLGARLCASRWRLLERISHHARDIYAALADGEQLDVVYVASWMRFEEDGTQKRDGSYAPEEFEAAPPEVSDVERELVALAQRLVAQEMCRKTSLVGPHKDEVVFFLNGKNARMFASQGQQRTIVLCFKLAQVRATEELCGTAPLLLLDDVMSELDEARRDALAQFVQGRVQTVMTTANIGYFSEELIDSSTVIEVPIPGTRHVY